MPIFRVKSEKFTPAKKIYTDAVSGVSDNYQVWNLHVQRVQNMYGKVFKAELRPAEVDPRFKVFLDLIAVSKIKLTLLRFCELEFWNE